MHEQTRLQLACLHRDSTLYAISEAIVCSMSTCQTLPAASYRRPRPRGGGTARRPRRGARRWRAGRGPGGRERRARRRPARAPCAPGPRRCRGARRGAAASARGLPVRDPPPKATLVGGLRLPRGGCVDLGRGCRRRLSWEWAGCGVEFEAHLRRCCRHRREDLHVDVVDARHAAC